MVQIRLKYVLGDRGLQLAAPSYQMIEGSHQPITAGVNNANGLLPGISIGDPRLANITVLAEVPPSDVNAAGDALDPSKVTARYPNHFLVTNGAIK